VSWTASAANWRCRTSASRRTSARRQRPTRWCVPVHPPHGPPRTRIHTHMGVPAAGMGCGRITCSLVVVAQAVVKIMAKDFVRVKRSVTKFLQLRTYLQVRCVEWWRVARLRTGGTLAAWRGALMHASLRERASAWHACPTPWGGWAHGCVLHSVAARLELARVHSLPARWLRVVVQGIGLQLQTMKSVDAMATAMKNATKVSCVWCVWCGVDAMATAMKNATKVSCVWCVWCGVDAMATAMKNAAKVSCVWCVWCGVDAMATAMKNATKVSCVWCGVWCGW
jgi:hypothetical protein